MQMVRREAGREAPSRFLINFIISKDIRHHSINRTLNQFCILVPTTSTLRQCNITAG
jgi:hypothetical protein